MAKREVCGNDCDKSFEIRMVLKRANPFGAKRGEAMKRHDEQDASGLFLGSEPLVGGVHERKAMGDRDGKDLGGKSPKDSGDDDASDKRDSDSTDKGDSDSSDKGDSDGKDKGDSGDDSRDGDGKD